MTGWQRTIGWLGVVVIVADVPDLAVSAWEHWRLHQPSINRRMRQLEAEVARVR